VHLLNRSLGGSCRLYVAKNVRLFWRIGSAYVIVIASNSSGGSFNWTRGSITCVLNGFSKFNYFPSATQPNSLFGVRITILIMALTTFLTRFLQCFLELLNFFGELHEMVVYGITFCPPFLAARK
jgi:hypothetical protein